MSNKNNSKELIKCPACGQILKSFATTCPSCGTELRNLNSTSSITIFTEKLEEIEKDKNNEELDFSGIDGCFGCSGCITVFVWILFWWILLPIIILKYKTTPTKKETLKKEYISNFTTPNSKEDLTEFTSLFASKIEKITPFNYFYDDGKNKEFWNSLWIRKIKQLESKAALAMKDDKNSFKDLTSLASTAYLRHYKNKRNKLFGIILSFLPIALICIGILISVLGNLFEKSGTAMSKKISSSAIILQGGHNDLFTIEGDSVLIALISTDDKGKEWNVNIIVSLTNTKKFRAYNLNTHVHNQRYDKYYHEEINGKKLKCMYLDSLGVPINMEINIGDLGDKMNGAIQSKKKSTIQATLQIKMSKLGKFTGKYKAAKTIYDKIYGVEIDNIAFDSDPTY